jgi:rhamnosyltransferase
MHDWWLNLAAQAFGLVIFIDEGTLMYRQHAANTVGFSPVLARARKALTGQHAIQSVAQSFVQAREFYRCFEGVFGFDARSTVQAWLSLPRAGIRRRLTLVARNGFFKKGLLRNIAYLWVICAGRHALARAISARRS